MRYRVILTDRFLWMEVYIVNSAPVSRQSVQQITHHCIPHRNKPVK